MSIRYRLGAQPVTARQLARFLEDDPQAAAPQVAAALRRPTAAAPSDSIEQLEDVMARLAREDTSDVAARDRLAAAVQALADAIAAHTATGHDLDISRWAVEDALKECRR